jgi:predicted RNA-binding Zn ribbon-like protein
VSKRSDRQVAPGELETVRELLNSWQIPNDTRVPEDHLDDFVKRQGGGRKTVKTLRELRDDLRAVVEGAADADRTLTTWVERLGLRTAVEDTSVVFRHRAGPPGDILSTVLESVIEGTWSRLKACPDCRWAFYDHTRSASKRWCVMNRTEPGGRSCGNIAKVRRHRERSKVSATKRSRRSASPQRRTS